MRQKPSNLKAVIKLGLARSWFLFLLLSDFDRVACSAAVSLPALDFCRPDEARLWANPHELTVTSDGTNGLCLQVTGSDPYFFRSPLAFTGESPLWLKVRMRSSTAGWGQLFWFQSNASEAESVRFLVPSTEWFEARVPIPALQGSFSLRFDCPGSTGDTTRIQRIWFEPRPLLTEPDWPDLADSDSASRKVSVVGPGLRFNQDRQEFNGFTIDVQGQPFAFSSPDSPIGYLQGSKAVWFNLRGAEPIFRTIGAALRLETTVTDPQGALWRWTRRVDSNGGGLRIRTSLSVDQIRDCIFVPGTLLLAGSPSFGTNKSQALLAGVEYLENEDSSSERDIIGPSSLRRVPDSSKLTLPLMSLAAGGRWLSLDWIRANSVAPLFDSPDRVFHSGRHLLGIIAPGSNGTERPDGALLPYGPLRLDPTKPLEFTVTLRGGFGSNMVPALEAYFATHPLPQIPATGISARDFWRLEAGGWLDSGIRKGAQYRHAIGNGFQPAPAIDAALWMEWLSSRVDDAHLAKRLEIAAIEAHAEVAATADPSPHRQVGHIRWLLPALLHGNVRSQLNSITVQAAQLVSQFDTSDSLLYRPPQSGLNLARTHWQSQANGLAATALVQILRAATLTGDVQLKSEGLRLFKTLSRWRGGVPRGAQTWEVPLHTPDILASAHLCEAGILAFELTGDPNHLDEARYWAWTGVPFVYLVPPVADRVGLYSTIPVLGATQFVAPNWIGLPVQWCGLVYAEALRHLAWHDEASRWNSLADGIAAAGIQHVHPASETLNQGLLPDSYDLKAQFRNPVPINPATLLPGALAFYGEPPVQMSVARPSHRGFIHAPGLVQIISESEDRLRFQVASWSRHGWRVLITGVPKKTTVLLNGKRLKTAKIDHDPLSDRLILELSDKGAVELRFPSRH